MKAVRISSWRYFRERIRAMRCPHEHIGTYERCTIILCAFLILWSCASDIPFSANTDGGTVTSVRELLRKDADINARDEYGRTALIVASEKGVVDTVQLLIDKGADIHAKTAHGETALIMASKEGHVAIVKLLIEKGADVEATTNSGKTALSFATDKDIIQMLKMAGAFSY